MLVDVNPVLVWISLAISILTLLGMVKTMMTSGEKEIDARLEEAERSLRAYDRRIQATESDLKHMPTNEMVVELKLAMASMNGTVGTITETLASVSRTVHRIDDYLREDAKK